MRCLSEVLAGILVAASLLATSVSAAASPSLAAEPVELRLLRTIFIGAPQGIEVEQIRELAIPTQPSTVYHLARAALRVATREDAEPHLDVLLGRLLEQLHRLSSDLLPRPLPPGFGTDDLIYTLVRALAVTGGIEEAERVLIRELEIGSQHKKHVILEALHQLGSRGAKAAIQKASEQSDLWYLASNLLTDYRSPTLVELAQHWGAIERDERLRSRLMKNARRGCADSGPGLLAVHLLGYMPPHPVRIIETGEIGLLRSLVGEAPCPNGRLFGSQALALRSAEAPVVWRQALDRAGSAWERRQLLRAFWVRQPAALADEALYRLETEPTQLVQWELMWGLVYHEQGEPLRDFWGLWFLSPHSQFRHQNRRRFEVLRPAAVDRILGWLEQGRRPSDDRVLEWLLVSVVRGARGSQVERALARLDESGLPNEASWIYTEITDPAALPWLRRRAAATADEEARSHLDEAIRDLEDRRSLADDR